MFVKLVNPTNHQTMTFKASDEVYHRALGPMGRSEIDVEKKQQEHFGNESRSFLIWPEGDVGTEIEVTEIILPDIRRSGAIYILTNWDAWLCNENGRSIDRIHRNKS